MKTPLEEFIEWFKKNKQTARNHEIGNKATELLETEKKQIVEAFEAGEHVGYARAQMTGDEYFNNKFKK
jgi:hypothetical protein